RLRQGLQVSVDVVEVLVRKDGRTVARHVTGAPPHEVLEGLERQRGASNHFAAARGDGAFGGEVGALPAAVANESRPALFSVRSIALTGENGGHRDPYEERRRCCTHDSHGKTSSWSDSKIRSTSAAASRR